MFILQSNRNGFKLVANTNARSLYVYQVCGKHQCAFTICTPYTRKFCTVPLGKRTRNLSKYHYDSATWPAEDGVAVPAPAKSHWLRHKAGMNISATTIRPVHVAIGRTTCATDNCLPHTPKCRQPV